MRIKAVLLPEGQLQLTPPASDGSTQLGGIDRRWRSAPLGCCACLLCALLSRQFRNYRIQFQPGTIQQISKVFAALWAGRREK